MKLEEFGNVRDNSFLNWGDMQREVGGGHVIVQINDIGATWWHGRQCGQAKCWFVS